MKSNISINKKGDSCERIFIWKFMETPEVLMKSNTIDSFNLFLVPLEVNNQLSWTGKLNGGNQYVRR